MNPEKMVELQYQMKQHSKELQDFVQDIAGWEEEIKEKDDKLKSKKIESKVELPPVRNSLEKKRKKKKRKKATSAPPENVPAKDKPKRISGYDFKAWEKFDVDKACEEVEKEAGDRKSSSSSDDEYETDEEWEQIRKKQQAQMLKDQGNQSFKEGKYDEAVEYYTRGIECDMTNALLLANRAMALLKQQRHAAAELDCSASVALDPTYVKAFQRRATARFALKKWKEAKEDNLQVLKLEPSNKQAKAELDKLEKLLNPPQFSVDAEDPGIVKPVYKPPGQRSKKPLRRIPIDVIGDESEETRRKAAEKIKAGQSEATRKLLEKDDAMFEKFTSVKPAGPGQSTAGITVLSSEDSAPPVFPASSPSDVVAAAAASAAAPPIRPSGGSMEEDELKLDLREIHSGEKKASEKGTSSSHRHRTKATDAKDEERQESPQSSPRVPPVPTSSFQFQADWKVLKNTSEQFYQYLKNIEPSSYSKLFGQALDADILSKVFTTLREHYIPAKGDIYPVLKNLTTVKRFTMTIMFMSSTEKQGLKELFSHLSEGGGCSSDELAALTTLYEL